MSEGVYKNNLKFEEEHTVWGKHYYKTYMILKPATTATNWPECLKGDSGIVGNNESVV
jgi:hypothetical protein